MQRCGESLPCTCWGGPMNLKIFLNFLASPPASAGHCHALMRRSVNPEGVLCAPGGDLFQLSCFPSPPPSLLGHCLTLLQFLHLKVEGILCFCPPLWYWWAVLFYPEKSQHASRGFLSILLLCICIVSCCPERTGGWAQIHR